MLRACCGCGTVASPANSQLQASQFLLECSRRQVCSRSNSMYNPNVRNSKLCTVLQAANMLDFVEQSYPVQLHLICVYCCPQLLAVLS